MTFEHMTLEDVATLFGVTPITVPRLGILPTDGGPATMSGRCREDWRITRRDFAKLIGVHPDTLTKKLSAGLAGAVVEPGQHAKEMVFDLRLAWRFWLAHTGALNEIVVKDFEVCAAAGIMAVSQLSSLPLFFKSIARERKRSQARRPRTSRTAPQKTKETT